MSYRYATQQQTTFRAQYSKEGEALGLVSASFDIQRDPVSQVRLREKRIQGENIAKDQAGDGVRFQVMGSWPGVKQGKAKQGLGSLRAEMQLH